MKLLKDLGFLSVILLWIVVILEFTCVNSHGAVTQAYPSCDGDIWVPMDDCAAQAKPITVNYTYSIAVFQWQNIGEPPVATIVQAASVGPISGSISTTSGGTYLTSAGQNAWGVDISGCTYGIAGGSGVIGSIPYCIYNYTISISPRSGSGALNAGFTEQYDTRSGYADFGVPSSGPHTYSAYSTPPCNVTGQPNETSNTGVNYTNNTASPQKDSNGNTLQPGQGETVPVTWPNGQSGNFSVTNANPNDGAYNNDGANFSITNNSGTLLVTTNNLFPQNLGANSDYLTSSNAGPIIWQSDTLSNTALTVAAGDSAIVNADNGIQNSLNGLSNLLSRPLNVTVSNSSGGLGSNVWVENFPTNYGQFNAGTNGITISGSNINLGGSSNVWVQNFPTNNDFAGIYSFLGGTDSVTLSNNAASGFSDEGIAAWGTNNAPAPPPADSDGDASGMAITMMGQTLNFDPVASDGPMGSYGSGVCNFIKKGVALIATILFFYWLSRLYWEMCLGASIGITSSKVPDMEVQAQTEALTFGGGVGGNFLGVAVWWACQIVIVGLWVGLNLWFFSHVLNPFSTDTLMSDPSASGVTPTNWLALLSSLGTAGAICQHMIYILIPIHWLFTLFCSRITIGFSLGTAYQFATFVAHRLPGG